MPISGTNPVSDPKSAAPLPLPATPPSDPVATAPRSPVATCAAGARCHSPPNTHRSQAEVGCLARPPAPAFGAAFPPPAGPSRVRAHAGRAIRQGRCHLRSLAENLSRVRQCTCRLSQLLRAKILPGTHARRPSPLGLASAGPLASGLTCSNTAACASLSVASPYGMRAANVCNASIAVLTDPTACTVRRESGRGRAPWCAGERKCEGERPKPAHGTERGDATLNAPLRKSTLSVCGAYCSGDLVGSRAWCGAHPLAGNVRADQNGQHRQLHDGDEDACDARGRNEQGVVRIQHAPVHCNQGKKRN